MSTALRRLQAAGRLTFLILMIGGLEVSIAAQDTVSRLQQVVAVNSLDQAGKTPFHIKIAFQLYDLDGKPSDSGLVEQWWAAPGRSRTMIEAASLKAMGSVPFDDALKIDPRERYFVQSLLNAELHPVRSLSPSIQLELKETTRTFESVELTCFDVPVPSEVDGSGRNPSTFCVDPKTDALRINFENMVSTTTRNGLGTFHGTAVSLKLEIAFEKRSAITGNVTLLQPFDPLRSEVKLSNPAPEMTAPDTVSSVVTAGKVLSKVSPIYPAFAKSAHISGTVVLHAVITKQGGVSDIFPLASPTPTLTQSAINAVRQWTYKPYLLNGQPASVDTIINVNFRFGGF